MKKTDINKLLFTLVVLLITSCSLDDVSVDNGSDFTTKNLVQDEKSAIMVLNGVYDAFRGGEFVKFFLALTVSGTEQAIVDDQYSVKEFASNNIQSRSVSVSDNFYRKASYVINTSNYLITQLKAGKAKDLAEHKKVKIIAEAKTLRAYARFMLLRTYGQFYDINSRYGIVISDKPIRSNDKFERKSVKESYGAIIADLEFGVANSVAVKSNFYVTKTTAKAFLAKVYLYKKDFVKAERLSKEIIEANSGGYALETSYANIYSKRWESSEVLFAPHRKGALTKGDVVYTDEVFTLYYVKPTNFFKELANKQVKEEAVKTPKGGTNYTKGYDPRLVFANKDGNVRNNKYSFYNDKEDTIYYMRMAEVYLIYAEAAARNNNLTAAVTAVNAIRNRANAGITNPDQRVSLISSTNKVEVLDLIRKEKMLELFTETGETWFDLARYLEIGDLTFGAIKGQKKTLTEKNQLIFPIPSKAIRGNNKLVQNPGYF